MKKPVKNIADMIDVISLGAGKQSSYMLLNALEGKFRYKPDLAIFSDTGCEPQYVYDYLKWLKEYCKNKYDFEIITVSYGNLINDIKDYITGKRKRDPLIPLRLSGNGGMMNRHCTVDYKIAPMRKYLQSIRNGKRVRFWIGISLDEIERMRESPVKYIDHYYPLIENKISIDGILSWYEINNLPEPGKSACLICPFHSWSYWSLLKRFQRKEFEKACEFDDLIRNYPKLRRQTYLSNQLKPLREIDFSKHPTLFPELIDECHGMCGL